MIDNKLIEKNTQFIKSALDNRNKVSEFLYTIENILPIETIDKLREFVKNNKNWVNQEDQKGYPNNPLRSKIDFETDTVVEEVYTSMQNLNHIIEEVVGIKVDFLGSAIWRDVSEYHIDWHTDNPILTATLQVYLFGDNEPGTTFKTDTGEFTCKFKTNTGYFARQHTKDRPQHKIEKKVVNERYSLFFTWGLPNSKVS